MAIQKFTAAVVLYVHYKKEAQSEIVILYLVNASCKLRATG